MSSTTSCSAARAAPARPAPSRSPLSLGADEAKLREEMKDPAITETFDETYELANKLAITGTPSYVVGNEVVFGALGPRRARREDRRRKAACATAAC